MCAFTSSSALRCSATILLGTREDREERAGAARSGEARSGATGPATVGAAGATDGPAADGPAERAGGLCTETGPVGVVDEEAAVVREDPPEELLAVGLGGMALGGGPSFGALGFRDFGAPRFFIFVVWKNEFRGSDTTVLFFDKIESLGNARRFQSGGNK